MAPTIAKGETPRRAFRIPEALWSAVVIEAAKRGETVTDVVTRALQEYVKHD